MNMKFAVVVILAHVLGHASTSVISEKKNFQENNILRDGNSVAKSDDVDGHQKKHVEGFEFNGDKDMVDSDMSVQDQVRLLSKQLNALMTRRREDYKMLEDNLRKSLRITSNAENMDMDIRAEMEQLRHEIKILREGRSSNKEKLTVEWLSQSIAEIRKELTELQEIASNASKDVNRRSKSLADMATFNNDFQQFKLELAALKDRQETTEVYVRELREEALQKEEDLRRMVMSGRIKDESAEQLASQSVEIAADHKMRHNRILRQQIHDLEIAQRHLKRQLNELQYQKIGDRVHSIEIEQRRLANANFNLSRQISNLDKLHSSMLELLEDVEGIQTKMDATIPDVKREISKLEFTTAQISAEQSFLREEGHNAARSIQAISVSVSALQEERDNGKDMRTTIEQLRQDVERLQTTVTKAPNAMHQQRTEMVDKDDDDIVVTSSASPSSAGHNIAMATNLVAQLESVELQYESIINKLPGDCSQVAMTADQQSGLYLIAPAGQHRPTMAHCSQGWTTIQRRFDGSVDFNRSWETYAAGFGSPAGEYWMGNELLHHMTADNCTQLKIIMEDIYENTWLAVYSHFHISSRDDGYRLHLAGFSGNASDALDYQNGMQFSAIDVDRDISHTHCAANYEGGWWFSHCQHANLNGRYNLGLTWFDASRNEWIAVKSSQMLITKRQRCHDSSSVVASLSSSLSSSLSGDSARLAMGQSTAEGTRTSTTMASIV